MASSSLITPEGITSFITLKAPRAVVQGGEPRYSVNLIFDKKAQATNEFRALQDAVKGAIEEKWGNRRPSNIKSPFHDGAENAGKYDGYKAGDVFIRPWTKEKPGVVDINRAPVLDWGSFYAGFTGRAFVRPFAYETSGNKGVAFFLDVFQFLRPGTRLDGRRSAESAFPEYDNPDDDEI